MWRSHFVVQRGMALIAVLWLVAAMGIVISGVVRSVRLEASGVGLQRQVAITGALADAAIFLALQYLQNQPSPDIGVNEALTVKFAGQPIQVTVMSLNGLIDINHAPVTLLADLYRYIGGGNADAARALAQATVDVRQTSSHQGSATGFAAPEDLLRVPGFTYGLYANIADLVTADLTSGSGRINPRFSPPGVLLVLAGGDAARAGVLFNQRATAPAGMDTSFFKPESIEMTTPGSLKLQVMLTLPNGSTLRKECFVSMVPDPRSGLPWRVLRNSQVVLPTSQAM